MIYLVIGLFIGMILHEYMHGRAADALGDHTARNSGRLTLNPIPHIDPFGTILIPLVLLFVSGGNWLFGYAKPVPVNPFAMKKPKRDMMLIAFAGPLTNITLAFLIASLGTIARLMGAHVPFTIEGISGGWGYFFEFLYFASYINLVLGMFNLIPIPPLDGSHILSYFLPAQARRRYESITPYGFIIIVGILAIFGRWFFAGLEPLIGVLRKIIYGF